MIEKERFDKSGSVPERNTELELRLLDKFYGDYICKYENRIKQLDEDNSFIQDNSYNGVVASHHVMYKYKVGDNGETYIYSNDRCRAYEFLVEFDKDDPGYGIYYGCKGLIIGKDQESEIDVLLKEWNNLKDSICTILNNTFPGKDFFDRWQPTNNANNRTFWPFWIALQEGEDVVKVAGRATKLIGQVYKQFLKNGEIMPVERLKKNGGTLQTYYTNDAYELCLQKVKKVYGDVATMVYERFIIRAEEVCVVVRDRWYERCWQFKGLKNNIVAFLFMLLFYVMSNYEKEEEHSYIANRITNVSDFKERVRNCKTTKVRWDLIIPIFRYESGDYSQIKKSYNAVMNLENKKRENECWKEAIEVFLRIFPDKELL